MIRRLGAILTGLALAATGCDLGGGHTIKHVDKQRRNYTQPLPLRIEATNGSVTVHGLHNSKAITIVHEKQVTAPQYTAAERLRDAAKLEYLPQPDGVLLRVEDPPRGPGEHIEHRIEVTVPDTVAVTVSQANGPVQADRLSAGLDLTTTNGAITADDVKGAMRVRVSNGKVAITGLEGSADVEVGNGEVAVDARALTCPPAGCRATTTNGAIRFALPESSRIALSAKTTNGSVQCDLPLQDRAGGPTSLNGTLGGGGPLLTLEATNGAIQVLKRYVQ